MTFDEKVEAIREVAARLQSLLANPQLGIGMWSVRVGRVLDELALFAPHPLGQEGLGAALRTIPLSPMCAEGLNTLGLGLFGVTDTPERMAFVVEVLKKVNDTPARFPKGKWATVQYLEGQVQEVIAEQVERINGLRLR